MPNNAVESDREGTSREGRSSRDRDEFSLDQLERARDGRRPVVLYVSTASEDRRYARAREMCAELERTRFSDYRTATLMQEFTLVRVNIEDLERQTLRRYGIQANTAPQLIVYDCELRRLFIMPGVPAEVQLRDRLQQAKEMNEAVLERRDRAQRSAR